MKFLNQRFKKISLSHSYKESNTLHIEITAVRSCSVGCSYCPQPLLAQSSREKSINNKNLTLENLKKYIKNLHLKNKQLVVHWTGYSEACLNIEFAEMSKYLFSLNYKQIISTTLVGHTHNFEYLARSNAFNSIGLHLPDNDGLMEKGSLKVNDNYINRLKTFLNNFESNFKNKNTKLNALTFGKRYHPEIEIILKEKDYLFNKIVNHETLSSRAGGVNKKMFEEKYLKRKISIFKLFKIFIKKVINFIDIPLPIKHCKHKKLGSQPVLLGDGNLNICCHDYSIQGIICNLNNEDYNSGIKTWHNKIMPSFLAGDYYPCKNCEMYQNLNLKDLFKLNLKKYS